MEPSDVLKKAWSAVQEADLPDAMHPVAFREAVRLVAPMPAPAAGRSQGSTATATTTSKTQSGEVTAADLPSEDEIYDRVVQQTGVDRGKLEQVVYMDDAGLRISLPGLKLGKNNAERTRKVAQIITITRGFGIPENETSLELIRAECDRLKVYDQANFSSHIKALTGFVINGTGTNRRVRMKSPGIQAFPDLIDGLVN